MDEVSSLRQQLDAAQDENKRIKTRFAAESKLLSDQLAALRSDLAAALKLISSASPKANSSDKSLSSPSSSPSRFVSVGVQCGGSAAPAEDLATRSCNTHTSATASDPRDRGLLEATADGPSASSQGQGQGQGQGSGTPSPSPLTPSRHKMVPAAADTATSSSSPPGFLPSTGSAGNHHSPVRGNYGYAALGPLSAASPPGGGVAADEHGRTVAALTSEADRLLSVVSRLRGDRQVREAGQRAPAADNLSPIRITPSPR
jgi:hypothetical protein